MISREVRLASRPAGRLTADRFVVEDVELPEPAPGQLVVRNLFLSVDPSIRARLDADSTSYASTFAIGAPLEGRAVGEVLDSNADGYARGDVVLHMLGWREAAVIDAAAPRVVRPEPGVPIEAYLGVLGAPGLTAYIGLLEIAQMHDGDTVWVSAAAGAVGSVAGQLAKARGAARVIGSAGGAEKVRHLVDDLSFDAAFDHRAGPVAECLAEAAPDGIDVYFDNVGGDHLEAALDALSVGGRIAACGAIAEYDSQVAPGIRNLTQVIVKRLRLEGFLVLDHLHRAGAFEVEVAELIRVGQMRWRETVYEGIDSAPEAVVALLAGRNIGKMLVRV